MNKVVYFLSLIGFLIHTETTAAAAAIAVDSRAIAEGRVVGTDPFLIEGQITTDIGTLAPENYIGSRYYRAIKRKKAISGIIAEKETKLAELQEELKEIEQDIQEAGAISERKRLQKAAKEKQIDELGDKITELKILSEKKPVRTFSAPGGGAKGLVSSILATIFEEYMNLPEFKDFKSQFFEEDRDIKSWLYIKDVFDEFAGTSTGSIIAAGLAYNHNGSQYKAYEIAQIYYRHLLEVFTSNGGILSGAGTFFSLYNPEHLERLLKTYFKETRLDEAFNGKRCTIIASKETPDGIFKHVFTERDRTTKLWEACRRSGAAPIYFTSHGGYRDGGILENDATEEAILQSGGNLTDGVEHRAKEAYIFSPGVEFKRKEAEIAPLAEGTPPVQREGLREMLARGLEVKKALLAILGTLGGQQEASRKRVFDKAKNPADSLSYVGIIDPFLEEGMTIDSSSDTFIEQCFRVAQKSVFGNVFKSMLRQLGLEVQETLLHNAIQSAFAKIRSVDARDLAASEAFVDTTVPTGPDSRITYFRTWAQRRFGLADSALLIPGIMKVMKDGGLKSIEDAEYANLLRISNAPSTRILLANTLAEKFTMLPVDASSPVSPSSQGTVVVRAYTKEIFKILVQESRFVHYQGFSANQIQEYINNKSTKKASSPVSQVTAAATATGSWLASWVVSKNRGGLKPLPTGTVHPESLPHFSQFLLTYYNSMTVLGLERYEGDHVQWIAEALFNRLFLAGLYTLEDLEILCLSCKNTADLTNKHTWTRLDVLIQVLEQKIKLLKDGSGILQLIDTSAAAASLQPPLLATAAQPSSATRRSLASRNSDGTRARTVSPTSRRNLTDTTETPGQ